MSPTPSFICFLYKQTVNSWPSVAKPSITLRVYLQYKGRGLCCVAAPGVCNGTGCGRRGLAVNCLRAKRHWAVKLSSHFSPNNALISYKTKLYTILVCFLDEELWIVCNVSTEKNIIKLKKRFAFLSDSTWLKKASMLHPAYSVSKWYLRINHIQKMRFQCFINVLLNDLLTYFWWHCDYRYLHIHYLGGM